MNKPIPQPDSRLTHSAGYLRNSQAWTRASKRDRLWTAIACWLSSLTFAGPGQWFSGRPIRAGLWFAGEILLVGLWLLVAGATGGPSLGAISLAIALYHLISWVDAARCGWFFRKVAIESSVVRTVAMAAVVALAPVPAGMLVLGPGRELLAGEYQISESSMATALLGQHATLACPSCGYSFKVGTRPSETEYTPKKNLSCPMCGQDDLTVINSSYPPRDRILASKRLSPRRWDLLMFRSPTNLSTLYVKRVVGLPGEELQIINGEIFINGSLLSKPPLAHEEMWPSVLDTKVQDQNFSPAMLRWQTNPNASGFQAQRRSWLFDSAQNGPELLELTGELTDELAYNANALEYINPGPIHDVRLRVQISQIQGPGRLSLLWKHSSREVRASIDAAGAVSLAVRGLSQQQPDLPETAHLGRNIASGLELMLIIRDGYAYLYADRELLCQAPIGPFDAKDARKIRPQSCRLSIAANNCRGRISRIQLDRDVHYRTISPRPSQFPPRAAVVKIQTAHYYVLGDNSPVSHDSRLGWLIHPSLEGKIQPSTVPAELIQGVVTCIFWPPARWRSFR